MSIPGFSCGKSRRGYDNVSKICISSENSTVSRHESGMQRFTSMASSKGRSIEFSGSRPRALRVPADRKRPARFSNRKPKLDDLTPYTSFLQYFAAADTKHNGPRI